MLSDNRPKARNRYRCIWCPEDIIKGEEHVQQAGIYEGEFQNSRYHRECFAASMKYWRESIDDSFEPHSFKRGTDEER